MTELIMDMDTDVDTQERLQRWRESLLMAPARRERRVEVLTGGLFVAVAFAIALAFGVGSPDLLVLAGLVAGYAAALRIEFEVGTGYTAPAVLVLVPMLFLLPPGVVPLAVGGAHLLTYLVDVVLRRRHIARLPVALGQGWYAIGPALVFAVLDPGAPGWSDLPVVMAAVAAFIVCDAVASFVVDVVGLGESARPLVGPALWVYLVDVLLGPVGLAMAIAAGGEALAVLVVVPLCLLLSVFAQERRRRIDQALELSSAYRGTALLLGNVVEADDDYTGEHSRDVVALALEVGRRLGLNATQMRNLEFSALLHDVGKIKVPKSILHKPGKLTPEEWLVMKRHTIEGQRMLCGVGGVLAEVGYIVRCSHERFDGAGYPDGVAGEDIPIEARIGAACDAFNAMTTDRPYRRAMPIHKAVAELRRNAGTQFDPDVVAALITHLSTWAPVPAGRARPGRGTAPRTLAA